MPWVAERVAVVLEVVTEVAERAEMLVAVMVAGAKVVAEREVVTEVVERVDMLEAARMAGAKVMAEREAVAAAAAGRY